MKMNVATKRNKLEIYADMLEVAKTGAKKTHIVYKANLNFKIVKRHLAHLLDKKLLKEKDGTYFVTKKGEVYLTNLKALVKQVG